MKQTATHFIAALIGAALTIVTVNYINKNCRTEEKTVAISEHIDTVKIVKPLPDRVVKLSLEPVKLPTIAIARPIFCNLKSDDSVVVELPVEQKIYSDDSTYRAVISGYHATLDSMEIYNRVVEKTVTISEVAKKKSRWGISVGIGAVATPSGRVEPGIFAGVSYTFISF